MKSSSFDDSSSAPVFHPLFDFAETERVAARVSFNPKRPCLAQECFLETQQTWRLPDGLSDEQQYQAHFYLALGLFIWCRYGEQDEPEPEDVADWYMRNTALTSSNTLYIRVADMEARP